MDEMSSELDIGGREKEGVSGKILRIPGSWNINWGGLELDNPILKADEEHKRNIKLLFKSHGFTVDTGGPFNINNPHEFMIDEIPHSSHHERNRAMAAEVGLDMPENYTPSEILQSATSVVAKDPNAHRGESKFLLETKEQKVKFLAWALVQDKISRLLSMPLSPSDNLKRRTFIDRIRSKPQIDVSQLLYNRMQSVLQAFSYAAAEEDFSFFDARNADPWIFEDLVETPGRYATSLGVLVDGYGNIHYSQIARSDKPKDEAIASIDESEPLPNPSHLADSVGGTEILLKHPKSPFFIKQPQFISNIAAGGVPLLLNGSAVTDSTDREVLEALDIDPDHPQLPDNLSAPISEIGKLSRRYNPYVRVDLIKERTSGDFKLLEVNLGPRLRPEGLGLPSTTSFEECELALVEKMLS
jgi:hypothetical protein